MALKSETFPDLMFISVYVPHFAECPGESQLPSPSRSRLFPPRGLITDSLWASYMLLTAGKGRIDLLNYRM